MSQSEDHREETAKPSPSFRRWDLVVLMIIGIVVVGMLLPSVQRIRNGGGNRMACLNNLAKSAQALQSANSVFNRLPPAFGAFNDKPSAGGKDGVGAYPATLFFHLAPHLEHAGIYARLPPLFNYPAPNQYVLAPNPPIGGWGDENAAQFKVPSYICPMDITGDPSGVQTLSLIPAGRARVALGVQLLCRQLLVVRNGERAEAAGVCAGRPIDHHILHRKGYSRSVQTPKPVAKAEISGPFLRSSLQIRKRASTMAAASATIPRLPIRRSLFPWPSFSRLLPAAAAIRRWLKRRTTAASTSPWATAARSLFLPASRRRHGPLRRHPIRSKG